MSFLQEVKSRDMAITASPKVLRICLSKPIIKLHEGLGIVNIVLLAVPSKHLRQNKEFLIFVFQEKSTPGMKRSRKTDKDRIKRIEEMEAAYDKVLAAVERLREGIAMLEDAGAEISKLEEYSSSGAWLKDFEADEAGLLPEDLKRGVLSEDGLHNLLAETDSFRSVIHEDV